MKPGETPEEIAKRMLEEDCPGPAHGNKVSMFDVLPASDCWKCVAEALQSYGDRRGEEERAKALEAAARHVAQEGESFHTGHYFAQAIRSLAAAPSGDAKGTK